MDKMARTIIEAQYQAVHAQVMAEMQIEHLEPLSTEDEILVVAVNVSSKK
jgi:hypothetical protein